MLFFISSIRKETVKTTHDGQTNKDINEIIASEDFITIPVKPSVDSVTFVRPVRQLKLFVQCV